MMALVVKNPPANDKDMREAGSIRGLGRSPGGGKLQPPPVFLPGKSHGRGAWRATVYGVTEGQTRLKQLSMPVGIIIMCPCMLVFARCALWEAVSSLPFGDQTWLNRRQFLLDTRWQQTAEINS